jgi:mannitol 2-dehydrogenase
MTALSTSTIETLTDVPVPSYDRSKLTTGIVHFGLGNFHRAHHAMYIDTLMNQGAAFDWAICGVGVMPSDERMRDVLTEQDGLYTLVLKHADGSFEPRVIGSIHEYLYAPDDPEAVLDRLSAPTTRIVSLTITEGGYNTNQVTGEFDISAPDVRADLADGAVPRTVFGLVVEALRRRRDAGTPPFTVMSCDNIQGNGEVARRSFTAFSRVKDAQLADWIESNVAFPSSMVDRITPVTTDEDRSLVATNFGIEDAWPVVCEPFVQWVIEDEFTLGRPPYDRVGVQLVDNVEPYELMKLRLLNASHQAMAYFGYLSGHRYAHEAATDPLIIALLTRYMNDEATATLQAVPGIDLDDYKLTLLERFANPEVRDTLARLCAESSDRIPKWLLPVIYSNLASGRDVRLSASIVASWARYAEAVDETGAAIDVVDRLGATLIARAQTQLENPLAFLEDDTLFGTLGSEPRFTVPYLEALEDLHSLGAQKTLGRLLA